MMGAFCVFAGMIAILERYPTASWPTREAKVMQSRLGSSSSASSRGTHWHPHILVAYLDDGTETDVSVAYGRFLGFGAGLKQTAEQDIARYPVGRVVKVYDEPGNPRTAILERLHWEERLDWIALGLALFCIPLLAYRKIKCGASIST
nr:DUF3592 domain-containing protein [Solimonas sp. SE-A11]